MQPLIVLAVVGVAVGALGIGFLDNDIDLTGMVQQFGVGEATIESPASAAYIDFVIEKTLGKVAQNGKQIKVFKNIISACILQVDQKLVIETTIICKLTDINANVVIEGQKELITHLKTKVPTVVPIVFTGSGSPTNLVNNIHDVQLVIIGPSALVTVP